jgi:hypothetical protein
LPEDVPSVLASPGYRLPMLNLVLAEPGLVSLAMGLARQQMTQFRTELTRKRRHIMYMLALMLV